MAPSAGQLHRPEPLLDVAGSPFELSGEGRPWPNDRSSSSRGQLPRRRRHQRPRRPRRSTTPATVAAGVTRTNPDPVRPQRRRPRPHAATASPSYLSTRPDTSLADVAHTLTVGRRDLSHRRVIVATDTSDAVKLLQHPDPRRSHPAIATDPAPTIGFLFPGGGSQYPGMGAGLDDRFTNSTKPAAKASPSSNNTAASTSPHCSPTPTPTSSANPPHRSPRSRHRDRARPTMDGLGRATRR